MCAEHAKRTRQRADANRLFLGSVQPMLRLVLQRLQRAGNTHRKHSTGPSRMTHDFPSSGVRLKSGGTRFCPRIGKLIAGVHMQFALCSTICRCSWTQSPYLWPQLPSLRRRCYASLAVGCGAESSRRSATTYGANGSSSSTRKGLRPCRHIRPGTPISRLASCDHGRRQQDFLC
jgi:hypothetical protein